MRRKNSGFSLSVAAALAALFAISGCATGHRTAAKGDSDSIEERAPIISDDPVERSELNAPDAPEPPEEAHAGAPVAAAEWDPAAKICLVLGPGMARGFAHAGILEAVVESGLKPYCIVGSEMGALVGALYALNTSTNTLQWQLFKLKKEIYLDFPLFSLKEKLASGEKLHKFLEENFGQRRIAELKIPFSVAVTDSTSGESVMLRDEVVAEAIGASLALPAVFRGKELGAKGFFMSGSASSPLPIKEALDLGATHVIAVDLLSDNFGVPRTGGAVAEIAKQYVVARNLSKFQKTETPFLIVPDLRNFSFTDFDKRVEIVSVAKRAAAEALARIRASMRAPASLPPAAEEKQP